MHIKAIISLIAYLLLIGTIALDCEAVEYKSWLMKKTEAEGKKYAKSAFELQLHLDDLASVFAGVIEQSANHVIAVTTNNEVIQHALLWKINGIPTAYRALFHHDPAVAILDTWAFSMQMVNYFELGEGKEDFDHWYQIAYDSSLKLEKRLEQLVASAVPEGNIDPLKSDFKSWVREHPIARDFIYRDTVVSVLAEIIGKQELNTLQSVGNLDLRMEKIADQLSVYVNLMTKQARWQAELVLAETFEKHDAKAAVSTLVGLADSLNQISPVVAEFPELIAQERKAFLDTLKTERETILQSIDKQRIATLSEIDAFRNRIQTATMDQGKQLIDYLFVRALLLLLASLICGVVLAVLVIHLKGKKQSKLN
jgi:hypothetical protein